jgi:hypothetical protein
MEKYKLALLPFFIGFSILVYSWFLSYPLAINFPGDVVFNHISPLYWLGFALTLPSLFLLGTFSKSTNLKCIICIVIVLIIFSLSFFYFSLPTSDSTYFRGLTEYFIETKNLDPSQSNHNYFQWPAFFLIGYVTTSISGLNLIHVEFLLYTLLGILLTIALYTYASRSHKKGGFLAVIAFFILMFYFLNYQWAPFTLGFVLVLLLFMLETKTKNNSVVLVIIVLFFAISITHIFVASFFIIYLLIQSLRDKKKQYRPLFLLTLITYLLIQFSLGSIWVEFNIRNIFRLPSEFGAIIQYTLNPVLNPIDILAQNISRTVVIVVGLVCLVGFLSMLIKRGLRSVDLSIFLTGIFYTISGLILFLLGNRALAVISIPLSLGAAYLIEKRFRPFIIGIFLVILILFVGLPIHSSYRSFSGSFVPFQTKEESVSARFLLNNYNWTVPSIVLAHAPMEVYLLSSVDTLKINTKFETEFWTDFPQFARYDCILFTVGLENNFLIHNYTLEDIVLDERINLMYNNGFSEITIKNPAF